MPRIGSGRAGAPTQADDTDKMAVSLYGQLTAAGDTAIRMFSASGIVGQRVAIYDPAGTASNIRTAADALANALGLDVVAQTELFNDVSWDRYRNNTEITGLASAARTATLNGSDLTNYNAKGVIVTLDVTATADTPSITLRIQHRDQEANVYENLLIGAAVTTTGTHTYIVYPGVGAAAEDVVETIGYPLGRLWRVRVEHADADSITYSVGASYVL